MMRSGRWYAWWCVGLLLVEGVSWLTFSSSDAGRGPASAMGLALFIIAAFGVWLAWRRPTWLAWAAMAELFIGGKGYVFFVEFDGEKVSVRFVLFGLLMAAWLIRVIIRRDLRLPRWSWPPVAVLSWVVVMSVVGWMRDYGTGAVFTDMNGYLYIALLGPWWYFLRRDPDWLNRTIVVLLASVTLIGLKSWLMQLLFTQDANWIPELYRWIRQTGIGEITLISKNVYRIFFQSQIYALIGFLVVLSGYTMRRSQPWWVWAFLGSSLGVYLSLSRSLWLGLGVAVGGFVGWLVWRRAWKKLQRFWIILPLSLFVWMMTTWALNFPYIVPPPGQGGTTDAVVARLKSAGSTQASTARANQIPPLLEAIRSAPITGHGFGATVTYYSTDPRVRGVRTTSAFELGYLDMALHFGLVGLGLMGWWLWSIVRRLWRHPDALVWLVPTIALTAVHLTSPYLNHPLGLGWVALMTLIAYDDY